MSINGYNQFSPYYQQPQPSQQSGSLPNDSYGSSSFQSLSAYQSDHQEHDRMQPNNRSTNVYAGQSYASGSVAPSNQTTNSYSGQNYGGIGTKAGAAQDSSSSYSSSRPDTTALGSLAYASSLGQAKPQPTLAQLIDYNRARGNYNATSGYDKSSMATVSHGHQRVESQGSFGTSKQQASQAQPYSSSQTASVGSSYPNQSHIMKNTGRSSPEQHQNGAPQQQPPQGQRQTQYTPQRPTSAQAMPRPSSRTSTHNNQSPQVSTAPINQNATQGNNGYKPPHGQASNPQHSNYRASPAPHSTISQTSQSMPQSQTYLISSQSVPRQSTSHAKAKGLGSGNTEINGRDNSPSPAVESQPPTTVDPNQVFNHYEYQRRQSEAEAAKKAAEAVKASKTPKPTQSAATTSASPPADDVTQAAKALMGQSKNANNDSTTKEQIELEMKAMIEKMRDYKAKDPALFSQVWEDVKKGQPTQRTLSQPAGQDSVQSPTVNNSTTSPVIMELPAESELPAASSFPPNFDRGRYPMQRRRRGNMSYTPDGRTSSKKNSSIVHKTNDSQNASATEGTAAFGTPLNQNKRQASEQLRHNDTPTVIKSSTQSKESTKKAEPNEPTTSTKTFWPEHKKRALADAAQLALMSTPPNVGKFITADEIHALLDTNPSYAELCGHLESRGFVINRPEFARMLLAAVPDMNGPNRTQNPSLPSPPSAQAPPPAPRPPTQAPMSAAPLPPQYLAPYQSPNPYVPHYSPYPMPPPPAVMQPSRPPADMKSQQENGPVKKENPYAKDLPQSKQDKARKRNFEDIVDLTAALSDDDEFSRYRPKPKFDNFRVTTQSQLSNEAMKNRWRPPGSGQDQLHKPIPHQSIVNRSDREHLLHEMVVDPMNKRRDALKKNSYDPKTICRDILLASGRHPTMPPLNHHLDGLRERFMSVENNADLSTFRWDLVDPGGAPAPKRVDQLRKAVRSQDDGAQSRATEEVDTAISISDVATPQHPKVAVRVDTSIGGVYRPDLSVQPPENKTASGGTRRGRPPKRRYNVSGSQPTPHGPTPLSVTPNVQALTSPTSFQLDTSRSTTNKSPSFGPSYSADQPVSRPVHVPGRKGRPPGAKNRHPRVDKGITKKSSSELQRQSPLTPSIPQPSSLETSTPVRRSGLRNAMTPNSASGIAVVIPSRSPSIAEPGSAQKGKGLTKRRESGGTHPPPPSYKTYKCLWQACPAELHNLNTLRKHIRKQHRERLGSGPWPCKWADCYDSRSSGKRKSGSITYEAHEAKDADGQRQRLIFANDDAWDRHIERNHMGVYASQLGDGPAVYASDVESSEHLSDSYRTRISPRAPTRSSTHRTDPLPFGTDANAARVYHGAHNNQTLQDRNKAEIRALTAKKKAIGGMGIYMTGSDIANESKRQRLSRSTSEQSEEVAEGRGASAIGGSRSLDAPSSEDGFVDSDIEFTKV